MNPRNAFGGEFDSVDLVARMKQVLKNTYCLFDFIVLEIIHVLSRAFSQRMGVNLVESF